MYNGCVFCAVLCVYEWIQTAHCWDLMSADMALHIASVSIPWIKYHINGSSSRSMLLLDLGSERKTGKFLEREKTVVLVVQGGWDRNGSYTVAKDAFAFAVQTMSRQHSGSSLQQPLSWRRLCSGGGSERQFSELSPSCANSLSVRDAWA